MRLIDSIKSFFQTNRKKLLALALGLLLFMGTRFAKVGRHVVKNTDVVTKELVERGESGEETLEFIFDTWDGYNKANTILGDSRKLSKKEWIILLEELMNCYGSSKLNEGIETIQMECYKWLHAKYSEKWVEKKIPSYSDMIAFKEYHSQMKERVNRIVRAENQSDFDRFWDKLKKDMRLENHEALYARLLDLRRSFKESDSMLEVSRKKFKYIDSLLN